MKPLSNHLEIWGFEQNAAIFADGSLGLALNLAPVDPACWEDERANEFSNRVGQFLNSLPSGISVQFVQDIVPGNKGAIDRHVGLSSESKNALATTLCQERANRLQKQDDLGLLPAFSLKLFVRKPPTKGLVDRPKIFSKERLFEPVAEDRLKIELQDLYRLRDRLGQELLSLGIATTQLSTDEMAELLYKQWNPARKQPLASYDPDDIRNTVLFSDVGISHEGFCIGKRHFRLLSLKVLPDATHSTMAAALCDLPFQSRLFLTVFVPDQLKEIEKLKTQRRIAYSMTVGKKSVSDIESNAKLQDLESLLEEMIADGEKVFDAALNVVLQSDDLDSLEAQVDQVLAKFRELGGAEGMQETIAAYDIFRKIALPNARCAERAKKLKTSNLADLIPLYGPWVGHDTPRVLFRNRSGGVLKLDFFDSSLSNANHLISGASGSGKSALTTLLTLQMLKENPKVFFVDIGGSYKKLTENLSGQYLALGVNEEIALNPFDLSEGERSPSPQKIKFLLGMVELMVKEEETERLPKLARVEIERAIEQVYETCSAPRLSSLRDILLAHPEKEIAALGKVLGPWCGNTLYGRFLDRPTTVELKRDIIAFDLKGLEQYPDLQSICFYLITDLVWREVQREPARMKFLVFDECWKLLKKAGVGIDFIEEVFRTFRKYRASAIAICQAISDFLNSKISSALLSTCSLKWILPQSQAEFLRMKEALGLNDNELQLIQSLRQKKGEYSEAFLIAGQDARTVVVIEPTPLELWIATTDPKDLAAVEDFKMANPDASPLETLKELSAKYPNGVSGGKAA